MHRTATSLILLILTATVANGGEPHWAFRSVEGPEIPVTAQALTGTPVDCFIQAQLDAKNLTPNSTAERSVLLRRLHFDVIGLPPTLDAVERFLADTEPDAYESQVDRLLASPHFGERWGRHWLDLARYADSGGFHNDIDRPNAWRYRDYVIGSLNADKPYSRFVREQIAGDEIPDATLEEWTALAFCRNGPSNEDNMGTGLAAERYRLDELDDVVSTVGNVFLGLTVGCARCHDHKYDPITQADYYRFLAFFDATEKRRLTLEGFTSRSPTLKPANAKPDSFPYLMVRTDYGQKPRTTHVLLRGDPTNRGPIVSPGVPALLELGEMTPDARPRSQLADWITDPNNPLTWRVMANRVWQHYFGEGLVSTPSNFGKLGTPPTHPELLDWLAVELRDHDGIKDLHRLILTSTAYQRSSTATGDAQAIDPENRLLWRMNLKRLEAEPLRDAFMVVAGTLNSAIGGPGVKPRVRPDLLIASQRNKWPVVKREGPAHWRRGVYVYVKRQLQMPMLELFDAPSSNHSCARREESLVPTQALVLMNDEFVRDQAARFAERVVREVGTDRRALYWSSVNRKNASERIA